MVQNIDMQGAYTTNDSITRAALEAGVQNALVFDLGRDNMSSSQRVIWARTSSPTSPLNNTALDGELWSNLNALTGGPSRRVSLYNGVAGVWMDLATAYYATGSWPSSGPASAYQVNGQLWYDMTLQMWRVWRDSTFDPVGIRGWHPVDSAFQLMNNENAGSISQYSVVIHGALTQGINYDDNIKDPSVAGVAMEAIATGTYGVVCTVEGGGRCLMNADQPALHAVAVGDGIIHSAVAAKGRTVGPLQTAAHPAAGTFIQGIPFGCFARAESAVSSGTCKIKMLGSVGTGARVFMLPASIRNFVTTSPEGSWLATDFSLLASGTVGAQGSSTALVNVKHDPIIAAEVEIAATIGVGSGGDQQLDVSSSKDGVTIIHKFSLVGQDIGSPNPLIKCRTNLGITPTSAGTPFTGAGSIGYINAVTGNGGTWALFQVLMPSYIY